MYPNLCESFDLVNLTRKGQKGDENFISERFVDQAKLSGGGRVLMEWLL